MRKLLIGLLAVALLLCGAVLPLVLARHCPVNRTAFEQIKVENVSRLARLPKHVVRSVDRIADRPLIEQLQTASDMGWRRLDLDISNLAGREARTQFGLLNINRNVRFAVCHR